ncbi:hypothetical protein MMAD_28420 [Mycolicibacterium madagascariense]|uniref:Uncharacterized protein n=1 Tax=Mycolicibacterium madagascariense TaxID=212765 RepID=A0A7I7XH66_9MYCO|nr:hypothetical protein MMAD_28420 [Mycolicibacterium madagascariense]
MLRRCLQSGQRVGGHRATGEHQQGSGDLQSFGETVRHQRDESYGAGAQYEEGVARRVVDGGNSFRSLA